MGWTLLSPSFSSNDQTAFRSNGVLLPPPLLDALNFVHFADAFSCMFIIVYFQTFFKNVKLLWKAVHCTALLWKVGKWFRDFLNWYSESLASVENQNRFSWAQCVGKMHKYILPQQACTENYVRSTLTAQSCAALSWCWTCSVHAGCCKSAMRHFSASRRCQLQSVLGLRAGRRPMRTTRWWASPSNGDAFQGGEKNQLAGKELTFSLLLHFYPSNHLLHILALQCT